MIITHKITMELTRYNVLSSIDVMQSDKYSRNLEVTLLASGQPWEIPEDATILIRYRKPDSKGGEYDTLPDGTTAWKIEGNVVTVALAPQVCTVAGRVKLAVALLKGDAEINTFVINLNVNPNPGANVAGSEGYYYIKSLESRIEDLENDVAYSVLTLNAEAVGYMVTMDASQFNVVPKAGDWAISVNNMLYRVYEVNGTKVTLTHCCGMQGTAGADGVTPHIGENGNWWIEETDTGVAAGGSGSGLPKVTEADNGKILQVVNGAWALVTPEDSSVVTYLDSSIGDILGGEY